jgi:hypothetical protein
MRNAWAWTSQQRKLDRPSGGQRGDLAVVAAATFPTHQHAEERSVPLQERIASAAWFTSSAAPSDSISRYFAIRSGRLRAVGMLARWRAVKKRAVDPASSPPTGPNLRASAIPVHRLERRPHQLDIGRGLKRESPRKANSVQVARTSGGAGPPRPHGACLVTIRSDGDQRPIRSIDHSSASCWPRSSWARVILDATASRSRWKCSRLPFGARAAARSSHL